ncbi:MAG: hypothetical protein M1825_002338 [Sarcosagium campestre]|nr:MAG: hypothetical protein M1825_002338 [Sarcosagium campestre]
MNSSALPAVKIEQGDGVASLSDQPVKPEPDSVGATPSAMSDDDVYEDAGDLDFSNVLDVQLMRLPKWLWDQWSKFDDDEQIEIGTVRVEDLEKEQKMSILLHSSVECNKDLPVEYDLQITNKDSTNTYLFSEKDLPGYSTKSRPKRTNGIADSKQGSGKPGEKPRWEKGKRWQPYFRKAIPKQTALRGVVKHEVNCVPIESEAYNRVMEERARQAAKPARETQLLPGIGPNPGNLLAPGTLGTAGGFGSFVKTGAPLRGKQLEGKAARIPQNELMDLIYECFKQYNYWSLKSLKAQLNQPEAYLKSTLEMIAELVKTGRFAMTWTLKPENKIDQYTDVDSKDELAPDAGYDAEGVDGDGVSAAGADDDMDDENIEMEDVMPSQSFGS